MCWPMSALGLLREERSAAAQADLVDAGRCSAEGGGTGAPGRGHAVKAVVQHEYGAPQGVLRLAEVAMPVIGAEDVLVSVRAKRLSISSACNRCETRPGEGL